jgi:N6-L-threonylcarbamoyladenine synthase
MLVLGIESTCDETSCALVEDGKEILSNVVSSQVDLHKCYGGVVPELACRRHVDIMLPVLKQSLSEAKKSLQDIDLIAVAHGPGLIGALLIGLNTAKSLALALNKPFIGINHIEAHLYAAIMSQPQLHPFPYLGVVISGGHTALVKIHDIGRYELLGETVDDAIGEAFDKVAKILNLPYPGGPPIEQLALEGNPQAYAFKPGRVKGKPLDFSFSGLKTGVLYTVHGQNSSSSSNNLNLSIEEKRNIAASFQFTALRDIVDKTLKAALLHDCKVIIFGGGVSNNQRLRKMFIEQSPCSVLYWPALGLSLDNAAMIAGLGYHRYRIQGRGDTYDLEALTRMEF